MQFQKRQYHKSVEVVVVNAGSAHENRIVLCGIKKNDFTIVYNLISCHSSIHFLATTGLYLYLRS